MKRWQSILIGVVVSVVTLAYALNGNDISKFGEEMGRGRYLYILPTFAIIVISLGFRAFRWQALLNDRIALNRSFHIMNVGYFFSVWLPLRLNEVARSYLVTRLKPPISFFTSISSIIVERLIDLLAVVVLVLLAISIAPVGQDLVNATRAAALTAILGLLVLFLLAVQRRLAHVVLDIALRILPFLKRFGVRDIADRVLDGLAPLARPTSIARILFWTVIAWTGSVVAGFVLLYVFYEQPNWMSALLMIAIASIAIALPAVPGSVGPFEAAVILGLQLGGLVDAANPPERAFAFAVLLHIVNVVSYSSLGLLGLVREKITLGGLVAAARGVAGRKDEKQTADEAAQITEKQEVVTP
jgi:hypothetical protein